MGNSYSTARGLWKVGTTGSNGNPVVQNDMRIIGAQPGMNGFRNDGVGHSLATATPLPLVGTAIDPTLAKGVIVPASAAIRKRSATANYLADFWSFTTSAGMVTISAIAGRESVLNFAYAGATLDDTLVILNSIGAVVATSNTASLSETLTLNLAAGTYYAEVQSAGDPNNTGFFDVGSYFLYGSIVAVPEPSSWLLAGGGLAALVLAGRRKRMRSTGFTR